MHTELHAGLANTSYRILLHSFKQGVYLPKYVLHPCRFGTSLHHRTSITCGYGYMHLMMLLGTVSSRGTHTSARTGTHTFWQDPSQSTYLLNQIDHVAIEHLA